MKRVNADPAAGRNVMPRLEGGDGPQISPACENRLPDELHRELVGCHLDPNAYDAVRLFVKEGVIPTTPCDADEVAGWCLEQGLMRHFAVVAASELTIWRTMNLETVARNLESVARSSNGAQGLLELSFQKLAIGDDAAHTIAALLRALPSLEELSFVDCTMPGAGLEILSQALNPSLRALWFNCVDLSRAMNALAPALRDSSLETLSLARASIGNDELRTLCAALAQNKTVQSLHLAGNGFDDGTSLASLLCMQTSLGDLQLKQCKAETTLPVLAVLQANACRLHSLTMKRIDFDAGGEQDWYVSVANMLRVNTTLSELDLFENDMSASSIERIGSALENNLSVQSLALGPENCALPGSSIDIFLGSLKRNFSLTDVFLVPQSLTPKQSDAIAAQMFANKSRAIACSVGFMRGAGGAFGAALRHQLPAEAGERIAEHVFKTSTAEQFRKAGGPAALARINRSASDAAVRQRSLEYRNEILHSLNEGDHEGISELCDELSDAGVTILPEHMDGLMDSAAKTPGRLTALLTTLNASGMQSSASPDKLAALLRQAANRNDDALVAALIAAAADPA